MIVAGRTITGSEDGGMQNYEGGEDCGRQK
jgi:hypothetical protein